MGVRRNSPPRQRTLVLKSFAPGSTHPARSWIFLPGFASFGRRAQLNKFFGGLFKFFGILATWPASRSLENQCHVRP